MDEFDFDPFDVTEPEGLVLAAGSGILDDDDQARCGCTCGCERPAEWPGDDCDACGDGRHRDPADPDDER